MTIAPRHLIGTAAGLIIAALLLFRGPWAASAQTDKPTASNTSLSCEQSQQAMVRHTIVRGELQVAMQCVGPVTVSGVAAYDEDAIIPAVYRPAARPAPVYASRTVGAPAPVRRTTTSTRAAQEVEPTRSWKKTALVIGGSAGAGAGVGAIAGGKKGALIGAAIGGGAASIFEAIKRR
jgi:hypothetical protein